MMDYALLRRVNEAVNRLPYKSDAELHKQPDFWIDICKVGAGDCDDYALGKLNMLVAQGAEPQDLRLAVVYVEPFELLDSATQQWRWAEMEERCHLVLIASADDGDYMLDNRHPLPIPVEDLPRGYIRYLIQRYGGAQVWARWLEEEKVT